MWEGEGEGERERGRGTVFEREGERNRFIMLSFIRA